MGTRVGWLATLACVLACGDTDDTGDTTASGGSSGAVTAGTVAPTDGASSSAPTDGGGSGSASGTSAATTTGVPPNGTGEPDSCPHPTCMEPNAPPLCGDNPQAGAECSQPFATCCDDTAQYFSCECGNFDCIWARYCPVDG